MDTQSFLSYHTDHDWQRLQEADTIALKVAVFAARAVRITLVHPADNYLRKV